MRKHFSRLANEEAQGMVEFAIMVTMLLLLFLGTVDFARFLYFQSAISTAARVGTETAIEYCTSPVNCGQSSTPTTYDFVLLSATCATGSAVQLQPQASSCAPCTTAGVSACTGICPGGTCPSACPSGQGDICISYSCPSGSCTPLGPFTPGTTPSAPSNPEDVTVSVGYNFTPITPLINQFFPVQSCFSGDSTSTNHHTICASSTGRLN